MKRNIMFFAVVVVAIAGLLFAGKLMSRRNTVAAGALNAGAVIGVQAPDFELKVIDGNGKTMKLSDLRGKAVLVNFWATWCGPCKIEMPWFVKMQEKYGPDGLVIVGVAMDDSGEKTISDFAKQMKINYPIVQGTEKVGELYGGVEGLPTSFFLDRTGKIVDRQLGLASESVFMDAIKKAMGNGAGAKPASGQ
ncbi:MAG TPA: TlpA disulfide reductase family protein [Candidatus Saccharimonadales bacterium]|nr:TlpA disulfide reductase family protein [Candidatus Saccharimonadales bacterium]